MDNTKDRFGVTPMTFDAEIELANTHPSQAQTRANKRRMVIALEGLVAYASSCINYTKEIPEEDNEAHAQKVEELAELFDNVYKDLCLGFDRIVYIP